LIYFKVFLGAFANCETRLLASCYLSVRPSVRPLSAWDNSAFIEKIFMKFCIWLFFKNPLRKFKFI